jgi:hypothetical protein
LVEELAAETRADDEVAASWSEIVNLVSVRPDPVGADAYPTCGKDSLTRVGVHIPGGTDHVPRIVLVLEAEGAVGGQNLAGVSIASDADAQDTGRRGEERDSLAPAVATRGHSWLLRRDAGHCVEYTFCPSAKLVFVT